MVDSDAIEFAEAAGVWSMGDSACFQDSPLLVGVQQALEWSGRR